MDLLRNFFERINELLRELFRWVSDPASDGWIAIIIFILPAAFGVFRVFNVWRRRRLGSQLAVVGAQPLFGRIHRRRLTKIAQRKSRIIVRDFLDASTNGDPLSASLLGLPLKTQSFRALPRPRRAGAEVFAYSGEGLSTALASIALQEAVSRETRRAI